MKKEKAGFVCAIAGHKEECEDGYSVTCTRCGKAIGNVFCVSYVLVPIIAWVSVFAFTAIFAVFISSCANHAAAGVAKPEITRAGFEEDGL